MPLSANTEEIDIMTRNRNANIHVRRNFCTRIPFNSWFSSLIIPMIGTKNYTVFQKLEHNAEFFVHHAESDVGPFFHCDTPKVICPRVDVQ
jgi:hypothetical protein